MHHLPALDIAVLAVYLVGVAGLGSWFYRRNRNTDAFMAAGRNLPAWVVGLSIFGTYVSSISFLALPGKAYAANWNPFVFSLSLPIAAWVATRYFVPFFRRGDAISAYQHLEQRFGGWARTYAAVCFLLTQMGRMGSILYLLALPLHQLLGWDIRHIIVLTGLLTTAYTLLGGVEGVIWTDVVQSIVLIAGALVCAVLIPLRMPEGPGQLMRIATEHHKFSLGSIGPSLAEPTVWVVLVYGLFINLQNFGIDQSYVQRYLTAKSERAAKNSVWFGALLYLPISAFFFFIGTALFAYYTASPDLLPADIRGELAAGKADRVFPFFIVANLPPGLTGLLIASIFAAAMSTLSTSLNCAATLSLTDFYRRYFRPQSGEREGLRVLYSSTFVWGLVGTGTALAMIDVASALDAWWRLAGIASGGMLGLFLLGMISRKADGRAALAGVTVGVAVILWMTFSPGWSDSWSAFRSPLHEFLIIVVGTTAILIVGLFAGQAIYWASRGGRNSMRVPLPETPPVGEVDA